MLVFRSVFGNVLVGPTAEDQEDREQAEVAKEVLLDLKTRGEFILPDLAAQNIIGSQNRHGGNY